MDLHTADEFVDDTEHPIAQDQSENTEESFPIAGDEGLYVLNIDNLNI
jgi:hypothetical protein